MDWKNSSQKSPSEPFIPPYFLNPSFFRPVLLLIICFKILSFFIRFILAGFNSGKNKVPEEAGSHFKTEESSFSS
jgi:hypothetical protein